MLFSRVKISSFRAKAHLVFHWCLYNNNIIIIIITIIIIIITVNCHLQALDLQGDNLPRV